MILTVLEPAPASDYAHSAQELLLPLTWHTDGDHVRLPENINDLTNINDSNKMLRKDCFDQIRHI